MTAANIHLYNTLLMMLCVFVVWWASPLLALCSHPGTAAGKPSHFLQIWPCVCRPPSCAALTSASRDCPDSHWRHRCSRCEADSRCRSSHLSDTHTHTQCHTLNIYSGNSPESWLHLRHWNITVRMCWLLFQHITLTNSGCRQPL